MKPIVIKAVTAIFGLVNEEYYCIHNLKARPRRKAPSGVYESTAIAKEDADLLIEAYGLRLDYEDVNGRVWADPQDSPFTRYKMAVEEYKKNPKDKQIKERYDRYSKTIKEFLKSW